MFPGTVDGSTVFKQYRVLLVLSFWVLRVSKVALKVAPFYRVLYKTLGSKKRVALVYYYLLSIQNLCVLQINVNNETINVRGY